MRAAAEVRAAYRQITHDTTTLAATEVIAARPGLPQATGATLRAIEAGPELAHVVAEKADTPDLTGPAQVLSRRAHNVVEAGLATPPAEGDVVWVSPADILARRAVPVPQPVRDALRSASTATASAASIAAAAAGLAHANCGDLRPVRPSAANRAKNAGSVAPASSLDHETACRRPEGGVDRSAPVGPLR